MADDNSSTLSHGAKADGQMVILSESARGAGAKIGVTPPAAPTSPATVQPASTQAATPPTAAPSE